MSPRLLHKPVKNSASGSSSQVMMFWQMTIIVRQAMESLGTGEREAIKLFASNEGLLLDPVYTGRAAAGMIDLIRKGYLQEG